jgi:hypothetical protein
MKTVSISSGATFTALVQLASKPGSDGGAKLTLNEVKSALDSFSWGDGKVTRAEVLAARAKLVPLQQRGQLTAEASSALDDWFHTVGEGAPGGFTSERAKDALDRLVSFFRYDAGSQGGATLTADEARALVELLGCRPSPARIGDVEALRQLLEAQQAAPEAQAVLAGWLAAHPMPSPAGPLGTKLAPILSGLSWLSETDRPVFAVDLGEAPAAHANQEEALRKAAQEPGTVKVETRDFATEFARLSTPADPNDPLSVETARRFGALREVLTANLTDLRVLRVGEVDVDVYVLGKDPHGRWVGVMSGVVET